MRPDLATPSPSRPHVDGRLLRAQRTRRRIMNAVQHFAARGNLRPRVVDVARHAGVSTRSIFMHFDDVGAMMLASFTEQDIASLAAQLRALPDRELVAATLTPPRKRA